jgi:phospholipid/cholesterol/gamma-HCH transport system substrate-binding protein
MRTPVSRIEKIAGIFIFLALGILSAAVLFPQFTSGRILSLYSLEVRAPDGLGLALGDKVILQGIQVGEVGDLKLDEENRVRIQCRIYSPFRDKIATGTRAVLVPAPVIGSPKIRLEPGKGELLASGTVLEATTESTLVEILNDLSTGIRPVFKDMQNRIQQLGENLAAFQEILDAVNSGKGSAGKLINDDELYRELLGISRRVDQTLASLEKIRDRVDDFSTVLPGLKEDLADSSGKLRRSLGQVEKGLDRFPEAAEGAVSSLEEAKKILESLKRNFFIRGNLPRDPEVEAMAPASPRSPAVPREARTLEAKGQRCAISRDGPWTCLERRYSRR